MARFCRGLSAGCFGAALVVGLFVNIIILFKAKDGHSGRLDKKKLSWDQLEKVDEKSAEEPLPLPQLLDENALLLGKKTPQKVKLAIGIVLWGNEESLNKLVNTIREIVRQDPKPNGSRSLVVVLLLVDNSKASMTKVIDVLEKDAKEFFDKGYLNLVISPFDSNPELLFEIMNSDIKEQSKLITMMNYRLSFMYRYCAGVAKNAMIIESNIIVTEGAISTIYKEMQTITDTTLQIDFSGDLLLGKLYNGKYLPRIYATFHAMAQLAGHPAIMRAIKDTSVHTNKMQYKGREIFKYPAPWPAGMNPAATVTSTLEVVSNHDANVVYSGKGFSWFRSSSKGGLVTVTLKEPADIKEIYVETGLDSLKRDAIPDAVLELSYGKDIDSHQCVRYEVAASFKSIASVHISASNNNTEAKAFFAKPIHCIQIRLTENNKDWAAIRQFVVRK